NYTDGGDTPLYARAPMSKDPLRDLAAPQQSNVTSISSWTRTAAVKVGTGETKTFSPGIYEDMQISGSANATFNHGVYIFSPTKANQGFKITGSPTVTGDGVMFYMTGSNYLDTSAVHCDVTDDAQNALDGLL